MNNDTGIEQGDEDLLNHEVSDEALEAAAAIKELRGPCATDYASCSSQGCPG
ncbi:MAG: hypothetical protein WBB34_12210 [Xanthobacteraceae bacterium]